MTILTLAAMVLLTIVAVYLLLIALLVGMFALRIALEMLGQTVSFWRHPIKGFKKWPAFQPVGQVFPFSLFMDSNQRKGAEEQAGSSAVPPTDPNTDGPAGPA